MSKFYIIWNQGKREGVITDDLTQANYAISKNRNGWKYAVSCLVEDFIELYENPEEDEDGEITIQEIYLEETT